MAESRLAIHDVHDLARVRAAREGRIGGGPGRRPAGRRPAPLIALALLAAVAGLAAWLLPHRLVPADSTAWPVGSGWTPPAGLTERGGGGPASATPPAIDAGRVRWPDDGSSAGAVVTPGGVRWLAGRRSERAVPIASVAKVMTAYVVLRDHPLEPGDDGPAIVVSAAEASGYADRLAEGESLVPVRAGEALRERDALEALLLASANNVADILARYDAGSREAFVAKMNATARTLGMRHTTYTDPSGLDPATVSSAADQARLAVATLSVPALGEIAGLASARVPLAGVVRNYNTLLGHDGVVGLKTGSTSAAGGCLVATAVRSVRVPSGGRAPAVIVAVVLGQPGSPRTILPHALAAGRALVRELGVAVD